MLKETGNILLIVDHRDIVHLRFDQMKEHNWDIVTYAVDYNRLRSKKKQIERFIQDKHIDFILFSRNDQIGERIEIGSLIGDLKIGYSSFSGIDSDDHAEQMKQCFNDFICGGGDLAGLIDVKFDHGSDGPGNNTYAIVFDCEQLGGVKYGLPRLLRSCRDYSVKATFCMTNFVASIYPDAVKQVIENGHELALHGMYHEHLDLMPMKEQVTRIKTMIADIGCPVKGANFIGRMNQDSIASFVECGLDYYLAPRINSYRAFRYPRISCLPYRVDTPTGSIMEIPLSVETYSYPWFSVRNMICSAMETSIMESICHISILCHPFRDGNLQHLNSTRSLFSYLQARGSRSITMLEHACRMRSIDLCKRSAPSEYDTTKNTMPMVSGPLAIRDISYFIPEMMTKIMRKLSAPRQIF